MNASGTRVNRMRAYLGLGSNVGERQANIEEALRRLDDTEGVTVTCKSSIIETEAVGGPPGQPDFLNAACEVETELEPHLLLRAALAIERAMGRVRGTRWGPRIIDIDLLIAGDRVIDDDELTLPHPRMTGRAFVLRPLAEIAPTLRHPVSGMTVETLARGLEQSRQGAGRTRGDIQATPPDMKATKPDTKATKADTKATKGDAE